MKLEIHIQVIKVESKIRKYVQQSQSTSGERGFY